MIILFLNDGNIEIYEVKIDLYYCKSSIFGYLFVFRIVFDIFLFCCLLYVLF